jgi:hypothetical protein
MSELSFLPVVAMAFAVGIAPLSWAMVRFEQWRAHRRNHRGSCARCGRPFEQLGPDLPYHINGLLVCSGCAARYRRELLMEFGFLGVVWFTAIVLVGGDVVWSLLHGRADWYQWYHLVLGLPLVALPGMVYYSVRKMKAANTRAQLKPTTTPEFETNLPTATEPGRLSGG